MRPAVQVQQVIVETSSGDGFTVTDRFRAIIGESAMNRLTLIANERIAELTAVRVQGKTLLWLGEVVNCAPAPDAMWAVQVRVKRSILIL